MAIRFKHLENENPFNFRGMVVFEVENPEKDKAAIGALARERVRGVNTELETDLEDRETTIKLLSKQGRLREMAKNDELWQTFESSSYKPLIEAAKELQKAYEHREKDPEGYEKAKQLFQNAVATGSKDDWVITPEEVQEIILARKQIEEHLFLKEIANSKDIDFLKKNAVCFLKDSSGNRVLDPEATLQPGETYTVDFLRNKTARNNVGLKDLDKWIHSGEPSSTDYEYVRIFDGYQIKIPERSPESAYEIVQGPDGRPMRVLKAPYGIDHYTEEGSTATSTPDALASGKWTMSSVEDLLEDYENNPAQVPEILLNEGKREYYKHVEMLHHADYGYSIYQALTVFAETKDLFKTKKEKEKFSGEFATDTTTMWHELLKGRRTITLDDISKEVFGVRFEKINSSTIDIAVLQRFFNAVELFMINLPKMQESENYNRETEIAALKETRENTGVDAAASFISEKLGINPDLTGPKLSPKRRARKYGDQQLSMDNFGSLEGDPSDLIDTSDRTLFWRIMNKAIIYRGDFPTLLISKKDYLERLNTHLDVLKETPAETLRLSPQEKEREIRSLQNVIARVNAREYGLVEYLNYLITLGKAKMRTTGSTEEEINAIQSIPADTKTIEQLNALDFTGIAPAIRKGLELETTIEAAKRTADTADDLEAKYGSFAQDVVETIESELSDSLTSGGFTLTKADKEEIASNVHQHLYGGIFFMINKIKEITSPAAFLAAINVAFGAGIIPLLNKNGRKIGIAGYVENGQLFHKIVTEGLGVHGSFQVGKKKRTVIGGGVGLLHDDQQITRLGAEAEIGRRVGDEGSTEIYAYATSGIDLADGNMDALVAGLGFDRDMSVRTARLAEKYLEDNPEGTQYFVEQIDAALAQNTSLTKEQRDAMKYGAIMQIKEIAEREGQDALKGFQITGGEIGVDLQLGELRYAGIHGFLKLGWKGKEKILYSRPMSDMDAAAQSELEKQLAARTRPTDPNITPEMVQIEMPTPVYVEGSTPEERTEYIHRYGLEKTADQYAQEIIDQHNEHIGQYGLKLHREGKLIGVETAGADGYVRLWQDPKSNIKVINGPNGVLLDLDKADNFRPVVIERRFPFPVGGETNYTEVIITDQENPNIEEIKNNSPAFLEWYQVLGGQRSQIAEIQANARLSLEVQHQLTGQSTLPGGTTLTAEGKNYFLSEEQYLALGEMSDLGSDPDAYYAVLDAYKYDPGYKKSVEGIKTGIDQTKAEELEEIVQATMKKSHIKYKDLENDTALADFASKVDELIMEGYNEMNPSATINTNEFLAKFSWEERIHMRQRLMEETRPRHGLKPPAFNKHAFHKVIKHELDTLHSKDPTNETVTTEITNLLMEYYEDNWTELSAIYPDPTLPTNPSYPAEYFPEGSTITIHVAGNEYMRTIQGYYFDKPGDPRVHGPILGIINWSNPGQVKSRLGASADDTSIRKIEEAILDLTKPEYPFAKPEDATFDQIKNTLLARSILAKAEEIYGPGNGNTLIETIRDGRPPTSPEQIFLDQFTKDIATILLTGEGDINSYEGAAITNTHIEIKATVSSGLYAACYNIAHSRHEQIVITGTKKTKPAPTPVESQAARVETEDVLATTSQRNWTDFVVGAGYKKRPGQGSKDAEGERSGSGKPQRSDGRDDPEQSAFGTSN